MGKTLKRVGFFVVLPVALFFGSALLWACYEAWVGAGEIIARRTASTAGLPIPPVEMEAGTSAFHMDARVEIWGALTITETLSMPKLAEKLPGGGGYTRVISKRPFEGTAEMMAAPSHEFSLDIISATCDGEVVPHHLHDEENFVRICVDPPEGTDPKAPHVYTLQYQSTRGLYFQFWTRFNKVAFTPLENFYGIPIEDVSVRITFPENVYVAPKRIHGWTGRNPYPSERAPDFWGGNTKQYEAIRDAPNVISLRSTAPFYDSENFTVWAYFPRGSVTRPLNSAVLWDFGYGFIVFGSLVFFIGAMIYCVIRYGSEAPEPSVDSATDAGADITETDGDSATSKGTEIVQDVVQPVESKATASKPPSHRKVMLLRTLALCVMAVGGLAVYGLLVIPLLDWNAAKSWVETPCRIAKLGTELRYDYTWEERAYSSDQYDTGPFGMSLSWNFERIKKESPFGSETVCYVNPNNPSQAVMSHQLQGAGYFMGFSMGAFIFFVGLVLLLSSASTNSDG
ncbi:MAG: DUF3592 domain-containing protein [Candidatus Hydrogenedentes bacterium]|nr:DUF3592 domain-containing protein [Candidatus Hydrogenedentota bacterium]